MVDGYDGRFDVARAFMEEAATATCDYDRKLFLRVGARYFKAACGVDDWNMISGARTTDGLEPVRRLDGRC